MTIRGSCLCGAFQFEIDRAVGPFEICHCTRCRKRSGASGLPMIGVLPADYRVLAGEDRLITYEAPVLRQPPPYHAYFCSDCGSPLPPPDPQGWFEIPAGLFDDDPEVRPDRHIFVELAAPWDSAQDGLPRFTIRDLVRERRGEALPEDHELITHYGTRIRV